MHSPTQLGHTAQQPDTGIECAGYFLCSGDPAALDEPAEPTYTLRFTEWRCGHLSQRPGDIPCQSVEQAQLILQAISNAIDKPGFARAVLFTDRHSYGPIYITDGYAETIIADDRTWGLRSAIFYLTAAEYAELQAPHLQTAFMFGGGSNPVLWNGTSPLDSLEHITLLSKEEIEAACCPVELHEAGERAAVCSAPPHILPGCLLMTGLRDVAAAALRRQGDSV